jgi:mRNA-degrading endonuclease HigB of HigAB toxin-antitoxin module
MRVVHWGRAKRFYRSHPHAELALRHWRTTVQHDTWTSFAMLKSSLNSADFVEGKIVFNIRGNIID